MIHISEGVAPFVSRCEGSRPGFKNAADFSKISEIQRDRPGPNLKITDF
jgi:hypothetical protein